MKRGEAKVLQKKMLKINKRKPSSHDIEKLFDVLEDCGVVEKKKEIEGGVADKKRKIRKKIASPPEAGA